MSAFPADKNTQWTEVPFPADKNTQWSEVPFRVLKDADSILCPSN